jgi:hypothetical protein
MIAVSYQTPPEHGDFATVPQPEIHGRHTTGHIFKIKMIAVSFWRTPMMTKGRQPAAFL